MQYKGVRGIIYQRVINIDSCQSSVSVKTHAVVVLVIIKMKQLDTKATVWS